MGTTFVDFGRTALFVLIGNPCSLGYLKPLSEIASVQRPQPTTPRRTTGSTGRRDDRHSKVGSPAGKDCVRNRARSSSPYSAENTYQRIRDRARASGRQTPE